MAVAPTLVSPANAAALTTSLPKFTATVPSPASDTQLVEFQIATNSGFTTGVVTLNHWQNYGTTFWGWPAQNVRLAPGSYWWRARRKEAGVWSSYTASRTFTLTLPAPTIHSPSSGITTPGNLILDATPMSDLEPVYGASQETGKFEIQVATDSGFTTNVASSFDSTYKLPTRHTTNFPATVTQTTWHWRARWISGDNTAASHGTSSWSATRTVIIDHPPTATLYDPVGNNKPYVGNIYCAASSGNYLSVPDAAALDITGDLTIIANVALDDWSIPAPQTIISKFNFAGNQRSYALNITTTGQIQMQWSANGTTSITAQSTENFGTLPNGTWKWIASTLDVNNGASGYTVRFWTSDDGIRWTQFGNSVVGGATTSIFSGTAGLRISGIEDNTQQFGGYIAYASVRSGIGVNGTIGGTTAFEFGPADIPPDTSSTFTARTGQTVTATRTGSPDLELRGGVVMLTWFYSNPFGTPTPTGYHVRVWDPANPGTYIVDTGDVTGVSNTSLGVSIPLANKDMTLNWEVRVRDQDNVWSLYSNPASFIIATPPNLTLTYPAMNEVIATPSPLFAWSMPALSSGRTPAVWNLSVSKEPTPGTAIHTASGSSTLLSNTHQAPPIIDLSTTYYVYLTVTDTWGIASTTGSTFTATYTLPSPPEWFIDVTRYQEDALATVRWPNNAEDADFISWRVYRRRVGAEDWVLLADLPSGYTWYDDWFTASGVQYEYAVVQQVERFSLPVETVRVPQAFQADNSHYHLICPEFTTLNVQLDNVKSESFVDDDIESSVQQVIGAGRSVEYGTNWGRSGTLEVSFQDGPELTAREKRERLRLLRGTNVSRIYLRNPFGDFMRVAILSVSGQRVAGIGVLEHVIATVEYVEVFDTTDVTL